MNVEQPPREGWICPRCGKVNAPWRPMCDCKPLTSNSHEHDNMKCVCDCVEKKNLHTTNFSDCL